MRTILVALALASLAPGQTPDDELRSKILALRYPPLARAASIQGDVRIVADSTGITAVSGPPLLRQAAIDSARSLGLAPGATQIYHFVLSDRPRTMPVSMTVKKGDAFDRFILRMLRLKTEKVVQYESCLTVDQPNDVKVSLDAIEAWIHAGRVCLETVSGI